MKGEGLPMTVIIIVVISIVILLAVIIGSYSQGSEGFNLAQNQLLLAGNITKKGAEEAGSEQSFGSRNYFTINVQRLNGLTRLVG